MAYYLNDLDIQRSGRGREVGEAPRTMPIFEKKKSQTLPNFLHKKSRQSLKHSTGRFR